VNDSVNESVKEEGTEVTKEEEEKLTQLIPASPQPPVWRILGKYIINTSGMWLQGGQGEEALKTIFEDRGIIDVISLSTFRERILRGKHLSFNNFQSQCRVTRRKRVCGMINFKL